MFMGMCTEVCVSVCVTHTKPWRFVGLPAVLLALLLSVWSSPKVKVQDV